MKSRWLPLYILVIAAAVYGVQVAHFYPLLPDRIATHFGPSGRPDGWMLKSDFVRSFAGLLAFIWALESGIAGLIERIPVELINLPNKQFWLAPERAAATHVYLRCFMNQMNGTVLALLLVGVQAVFEANLRPETTFSEIFTGIMVGFIVAIVVSVVKLILRFSRIPA